MPRDQLTIVDFLLDDPWRIAPEMFAAAHNDIEWLAIAVNYGVLAPSLLNSQPWRFQFAGDQLLLRLDRQCWLPRRDPCSRELIISCGAALFNIAVAVRALGREPRIQYLPVDRDRDCLAAISMGPARQPTAIDLALRDAIPSRRTHTGQFAKDTISADILAGQHSMATHRNTLLIFADDARVKRRLGRLLAAALKSQWADPEFVDELSMWSRRISSPAQMDRPAAIAGVEPIAGSSWEQEEPRPVPSGPTAALLQLIQAWRIAARERRIMETAPACGIILTSTDTVQDWLFAGEALQRFLLVLQIAGLAAGIASAPLEIPRLRQKIAGEMGAPGHKWPQMLLRFGRAPSAAALPLLRRPVYNSIDW